MAKRAEKKGPEREAGVSPEVETPDGEEAAGGEQVGPVEVEASEVETVAPPAESAVAPEVKARGPLWTVFVNLMSQCMGGVKDMAMVRASINEWWMSIPAEERKELLEPSLKQAERCRQIGEAMEQEFQSIARS